MEMKEWTVKYISYAGDVITTKVDAPIDATDAEVKKLTYQVEDDMYSIHDIKEIIGVY